MPLFRQMTTAPHCEAIKFCTSATVGDAAMTFWVIAAAAGTRRWILCPSAVQVVGFVATSLVITLVTGMRVAVPAYPAGTASVLAYGETIRDEGHREHVVGRPMYRMSRDLAFVAGRPCDRPGCAESADP